MDKFCGYCNILPKYEMVTEESPVFCLAFWSLGGVEDNVDPLLSVPPIIPAFLARQFVRLYPDTHPADFADMCYRFIGLKPWSK